MKSSPLPKKTRTASVFDRGGPPLGWIVLGGFTIVMLIVTLWAAYSYAPVERTMGIAQKIFYFHVPSAWGMYIGFGLCGIGSIVYLVKRNDAWDALAVSGAEVGLLFSLAVLITGPLWARKAWGTFWTWDPRLTTTLLSMMIFLSYVVLRSVGDAAGEAERRFASGLSLVGLTMLPIIHYSVKYWRGTHPTVITERGGGMTPEMTATFGLGSVLFIALASWLIWTRYRMERQRQKLRAFELQAAEHGLLEDV